MGEVGRKDREAQRHQRIGVQRLKETHAQHTEQQSQGEEVRETHFQHDAQRLLTLKASMDRINRQVQSQNEAKKKKQQKIKDERDKRKKDLLSEGKNPYEVWRREEMEADKQRQIDHVKAVTEMRQKKLIHQLNEEDQRYKNTIKDAKEKRLLAEEFQRQMGNYAK